jgi:formylglycine-generating enzyme
LKPLFCFVLVGAFAALAGDLVGYVIPDRKPMGESDPKIFTNSIAMKFAWIPPGTFLMGSPKEEKERSAHEDQHKVTLTKGFYMGIHLVTQEQWQAVMGNNPSKSRGEKNLPVEQVSWDDCQEFAKKLRAKDKKLYRLPTEAEWEYSCRAGTTTPFHFGETISTDQANYFGGVVYGNGKQGVYRKKPTPVGSFPANAWGLHDMHGNLSEWCQDFFGDYAQKDVVDPQGPERGGGRVLRGGSWVAYPQHCRSAYRYGFGAGTRSNYFGLRLCFFVDATVEEGDPKTKAGKTKDLPRSFTDSLGMKFVWIPPENFAWTGGLTGACDWRT